MSFSFKTRASAPRTMPGMTNASHPSGTPPLGVLPPKPPAVPSPWLGLGHMAAMRADLLGSFDAWHRHHGDICRLRLLHEEAVCVFSPVLVRELLVDHAAQLIRWERGVEVFAQSFGQSVLTTEGETWQRQRRMLQPAFTPRRVAGYAGLMCAAAAQGLNHALPAGQDEARVDMDALFARVAMDVILRTLFDAPEAGEAQVAIEATRVLSETATREMFFPVTLPDGLPLPGKAAKRRALRGLRGLIAGHIARRRGAVAPSGLVDRPDGPGHAAPQHPPARHDLLTMLLALRDEVSGEGLSAAELFDQCMVTFQAGHETTATALLWWSRLLAADPAAARRAQAEVDQALGGREPGAADLPALPWLTATLKEAMRLYPPIPLLMSRRSTAEFTLGEGRWRIARGTMLYIAPWVMQRDARWFESPEAFRPERFLPEAPPIERSAWMPFGAGPRVCIGQHFALLEMTLVAAMLLQRYELRLPEDTPPLRLLPHISLRPQGGVTLWLTRRTHR